MDNGCCNGQCSTLRMKDVRMLPERQWRRVGTLPSTFSVDFDEGHLPPEHALILTSRVLKTLYLQRPKMTQLCRRRALDRSYKETIALLYSDVYAGPFSLPAAH